VRAIERSGQVVHLVEHEDYCTRELYAHLPSLVADKENAQPSSGASNGAQVERDDAASSTTERESDGWRETGDNEGFDFGCAATDELAATNKLATEPAISDAITPAPALAPAPAPAPAPAAAPVNKRQVPAGEKLLGNSPSVEVMQLSSAVARLLSGSPLALSRPTTIGAVQVPQSTHRTL
jgi:hypothetical protein